MVKRAFAGGILFGLLLAGCAGVAIKYYGLEGVSYEHGKLLGPKPKDDIPFSQCKPDEIPDPERPGQVKLQHKCVVIFRPEFFKWKADYEDTKMRLEACEKQIRDGQ